MKQRYPWKWVVLSSLVSAGLLLLTYQMAQTVYLSPDTLGLACGAEHLYSTHTFSTVRTPFPAFDYVPCWTGNLYPALQFLVVGLRYVTPNMDWAIGATHLLLAIAFPLVTAWCVWNWKRQVVLTVCTAWVAALFPAAHSTLQLTPQGLLGTCLLLLAISLVIRHTVPHSRWLLVLPVLSVLYFSHTLSFFFSLLFLGCLWLIYKPLKHSILVFLMSVGVAVTGSIISLSRTNSIFNIVSGLWQQMQIVDQFQARPIWDHASVFGYVIIPLAVFGLTSTIWTKKDKWLLGIWLMIPFFLAHLDWVGLAYLPHRMLWYMAPSLILSAAAGLLLLLDRRRSWLVTITGSLVMLSLTFHTALLSSNNIQVYTNPLYLSADYLLATQQLQQVPTTQVVLTQITPQDRLALHLPRLITADIISFPANQFKNAKEFKVSQPYWAYLAEHQPTDPLIVYLKSIALMLEQPQQAVEQELYTVFQVHSILLRQGSSEAKLLKKSELFTTLYENDTYIILQP